MNLEQECHFSVELLELYSAVNSLESNYSRANISEFDNDSHCQYYTLLNMNFEWDTNHINEVYKSHNMKTYLKSIMETIKDARFEFKDIHIRRVHPFKMYLSQVGEINATAEAVEYIIQRYAYHLTLFSNEESSKIANEPRETTMKFFNEMIQYKILEYILSDDFADAKIYLELTWKNMLDLEKIKSNLVEHLKELSKIRDYSKYPIKRALEWISNGMDYSETRKPKEAFYSQKEIKNISKDAVAKRLIAIFNAHKFK